MIEQIWQKTYPSNKTALLQSVEEFSLPRLFCFALYSRHYCQKLPIPPVKPVRVTIEYCHKVSALTVFCPKIQQLKSKQIRKTIPPVYFARKNHLSRSIRPPLTAIQITCYGEINHMSRKRDHLKADVFKRKHHGF